MPDAVAVYLAPGKPFVVPCPHCGTMTDFPAPTSIQKAERSFMFRCACRRDLQVQLNFRRWIRKKVRLTGTVRLSFLNRTELCAVDNLSMTGLQLVTDPTPGVAAGQRVAVKLRLDDPQASNVTLPGTITRVERRGARLILAMEFDTLPDYESQALSFYLM